MRANDVDVYDGFCEGVERLAKKANVQSNYFELEESEQCHKRLSRVLHGDEFVEWRRWWWWRLLRRTITIGKYAYYFCHAIIWMNIWYDENESVSRWANWIDGESGNLALFLSMYRKSLKSYLDTFIWRQSFMRTDVGEAVLASQRMHCRRRVIFGKIFLVLRGLEQSRNVIQF